MSVTLERASPQSLGFVRDPMTIPSAQSDVAGNLGVAIFLYRDDGTVTYAAPSRHGDAFTSLSPVDAFDFTGQIAYQLADVGSFDVESSLGTGGGLRAVGAWLALAGVDSTTPVAGVVSQSEFDSGGSWAAPSLSPGGSADDINVSILFLSGWDGGFGDATGATIAPTSGGGRTLAFDESWSGTPTTNQPRVLVMTAPGGTVMSWDISGAQPTYAHIAFTVKAGAVGGPSLIVDEQPSATPSGYAIDPAPVVKMTTDGVTVDTSFTGDVTVELVGAGVLLGTLTVAAVAGVATFDDLRPCEAGTYTLRFSAAGVADCDSDPFTVTSGSGAAISTEQIMRPLKDAETDAARRTIPLDVRTAANAHFNANGETPKLIVNGTLIGDATNPVVGTSTGNKHTLSTTEAAAYAAGDIIEVFLPSTGSHGVARAYWEVFPDDPYGANASEEVAAIKSKTDQLVFTVANKLDVNMKNINDRPMTGNGSSPKFGVS